ncbi:MAG TPA: heavy-metal-associated domain-containing protein [Patescibacteria group bacterium]|nr:heavy-metal-associated domain-containing protein [Patescibacteria group bacterium]
MKKIKLKIDGMHCTSCAMNIDFDLEDLDGVKVSKTNYAKQETEIEFDASKVKQEVLIETIKKTGYKAEIA